MLTFYMFIFLFFLVVGLFSLFCPKECNITNHSGLFCVKPSFTIQWYHIKASAISFMHVEKLILINFTTFNERSTPHKYG